MFFRWPHTAYTCTTLRVIDAWLYRLKGHRMIWKWDGGSLRLYRLQPNGVGVEPHSHFPGWCYRAVCWYKNRVRGRVSWWLLGQVETREHPPRVPKPEQRKARG